MRTVLKLLVFSCSLLSAAVAWADPGEIVKVEAAETAGSWRFNVTVRHGDTGWDHYADGWRVENAQGDVLGYRKLHHPHENEQPFTRSLSGVQIPAGTTEVFVRLSDNTTGWADETVKVLLK